MYKVIIYSARKDKDTIDKIKELVSTNGYTETINLNGETEGLWQLSDLTSKFNADEKQLSDLLDLAVTLALSPANFYEYIDHAAEILEIDYKD